MAKVEYMEWEQNFQLVFPILTFYHVVFLIVSFVSGHMMLGR